MPVQRRLAAILAADVAGYQRHGQKNSADGCHITAITRSNMT